MNLTDIKKVDIGRRDRKRIGRGPGSGMGKTSSRGSKGNSARSGWSRRRSFEGGQTPLFRKLPIKGFNNGRFKVVFQPISLSKLNVFKDGDNVGIKELRENGVLHSNENVQGLRVKILANGDIDRKINIQVHAISKSAQSKIEAKGGSVEIIK
jgi:large subunit ribosomal protein L15